MAKFAVVPVSPDLASRTRRQIDGSVGLDVIRDMVQGEMRVLDGVWELRAQLCRDLDRQPIEDATVEWTEADSPFQAVATIHAGRQHSWADEQVRRVTQAMRFSPWIGPAAHRPLGNINRARREPYEHSAAYRARFNGCPIHEPSERMKNGGSHRRRQRASR